MEGQEGMPVGFAPTVEYPTRHGFTLRLGLLTACCVAISALPCRSAELTNVRSEREQLYEEISVEVDALEKQGGVLKKVVRLTTPTVVHIETVKTSLRLLLAPNSRGGGIRRDRGNQWQALYSDEPARRR